MRPLLLAGILATLVGCSLPNQGTSFKAVPKSASAVGGEKEGAEAATEAAPVASVAPVKTASAFPTTAQPTGGPSANPTLNGSGSPSSGE